MKEINKKMKEAGVLLIAICMILSTVVVTADTNENSPTLTTEDNGTAPPTTTIGDGYGKPGTIIWQHLYPNAEVTETFIDGVPGESNFYSYDVILADPLTLPPQEKHWISVQGHGAFPPQSGFAYHDTILLHQGVFKSVYFGLPDWTNSEIVFGTAYDFCFQLTGEGGPIIWDNGLDYTGLGASQWDPITALDPICADDFILEEPDNTIYDVHWIGGYWNGPPDDGDFDWEVTIYQDQPVPDLDCAGSLSWEDVIPGDTVNGTFTVSNVGEAGSFLNWEIESYPDWGNWTFDPESGTNLPDGDSVTVYVEVVAPDNESEEFTGEIVLVNSDDPDDTCVIDVILVTPCNLDIGRVWLRGLLFRCNRVGNVNYGMAVRLHYIEFTPTERTSGMVMMNRVSFKDSAYLGRMYESGLGLFTYVLGLFEGGLEIE